MKGYKETKSLPQEDNHMVMAFMIFLLLMFVATVYACFTLLPLIPAIVTAVIGVPLLMWLAILLYGLRRRSQPLLPFVAAEQERDAVRWGGRGSPHHDYRR